MATKRVSIIPASPDSKAIQLHLEGLHSADPEVREIAVTALRGVATVEVRAALAEMLFDPKHQLRLAAAKALGGVQEGEDLALRGFLHGLNDWDPKVREACAKALHGSKDPEAIKALYYGLDDEERAVRLACSYALEEVKKVA